MAHSFLSHTHTVQCSHTPPHRLHNAHRHACLKLLLYSPTHTRYSTYILSQNTIRTLLLAMPLVHKVSIYQPDTPHRATAGLSTGIYDILQLLGCSYKDSCAQHIKLMRRKGEVGVLSCALSFKSSFTFSPVHVPCGYTWEESEQGVPGRSLQRYASRLRFHLDQRHRGRAFTQPLNAIFLWPFPWKPRTVAAAQNTPQNRGSHFSLLVPI